MAVCTVLSGLLFLWSLPTSALYRSSVPRQMTPWTRHDIPNPRKDFWACGREGKLSAICDPDRILSIKEGDTIDAAVERFRNSTGTGICNCRLPDDCRRTPGLLNAQPSMATEKLDNIYGGWQPGIIIVGEVNLQPQSSSVSLDEQLTDFLSYIRQKAWNFGVCEDDFIILIAVKQGLVYTDIGENLEKHLPSACAKRIYREHRDWFHNDNYEDGVSHILETYADVINGVQKCSGRVSVSVYVTAVGFALMSAILLFLIRVRIRQCLGCSCENNISCVEKCCWEDCQEEGKAGRTESLGSGYHLEEEEEEAVEENSSLDMSSYDDSSYDSSTVHG